MSETGRNAARVAVYREPIARDLPLPAYATEQAAGMDLHAALSLDQPLTLPPGARALISTGLRIILPPGYEAQVRARSGWAVKHGIGVLNAPGTIDSDFRGVLHVLLINWGQEPFAIQRGDRIAQLVVAPVVRADVIAVETYEGTPRGEGGFGSTGHDPLKSSF
jgi:dUTP pyrophosphatase